MTDDDKSRWLAAAIIFVGGFALVSGGVVAIQILLNVHPDRWTTGIWLLLGIPVAGFLLFLFGLAMRVWAWLTAD